MRLEKIKKIKWSYPTDSELLNEIRTEYDIEKLIVTEYWPKDSHYKQAVHDIKKVSHLERLDPKKIKGRHLWKSYEELYRTVKSFGGPKDPEKMLEAIEDEKPLPMPIVVRKLNGELEVVGGNTRSGIAALADQEITALVIDEKSANFFKADEIERKEEYEARQENNLDFFNSLRDFILNNSHNPPRITNLTEYNYMLSLIKIARLRGLDVSDKEIKMEKKFLKEGEK